MEERRDKVQNEITNSFYLNEDRRENVKDYFKLAKTIIEQYSPEYKSLCDVGCATGDFLYYISKNNDDKRYYGVDSFEDMLNCAKERLPQCSFVNGDIYTFENLKELKCEIVCMFGVLYLFDKYEQVVSNLLDMVESKGYVYIFSNFNANGVAVEHRFRNETTSGLFMDHDLRSLVAWCEHRENVKNVRVFPFNLSTKIERVDDPCRTYTVELSDGSLGIVSGYNVWNDFYLIQIEVDN